MSTDIGDMGIFLRDVHDVLLTRYHSKLGVLE